MSLKNRGLVDGVAVGEAAGTAELESWSGKGGRTAVCEKREVELIIAAKAAAGKQLNIFIQTSNENNIARGDVFCGLHTF